MDNYILAYYQRIKDGTETVGKKIRQVYEMVIHGLEKKEFFFDQKKAAAAVMFMENYVHHHEGALAPGLVKLELWQKAAISCIYGIGAPDDFANMINSVKDTDILEVANKYFNNNYVISIVTK